MNNPKKRKISICLILAFSMILSILSQTFVGFVSASGTDAPVPGQNFQRTFSSNDTAPNTANLLWRFKMTAPPGVFSTAIAGGVVYQGCLGTGDVYAVNETTGQQIWHRNLNNTAESVTYYNGKIYTQGGSLPYDANLRTFGDLWVALDANTGDTVWTYQVPQNEWILPNVGTFGFPPIFANGKMYINVYNGIAILDPNTGKELSRWTGVTPRCFFDAYDNGDIVTVSLNQTSGLYYAVRGNPDSQTISWVSHDNPVNPTGYSNVGQGFLSGVAVNGDVYVNEYNFTSGTSPNHIYRIGETDGTIAWAFVIEGYSLNVAAAYENLYMGTTAGNIYAVSQAEGLTPVWQYKTGPVLVPVVAADEKVFFGSEDTYIYALDAFTGSLIWKYKTGGAVTGMPVIADNKLFISSRDNYLYAFGTPPPKPSSAIDIQNSQTVNSGQSVTLTGMLTNGVGTGISNANVTLQQRLVPRIDWTNITTVTTDSNGYYKYAWTPPIEGYYDLQAVYSGDALAPSTSSLGLLKVSGPAQKIDVTPLTLYLIAIIVLEIILIAAIALLVLFLRRRRE